MTATRTLPIPAQQREFTVKVDGETVDRANQLLAASILSSANRIASARLVYFDGSASSSDFPLSNTGTFTPGRKVEVLAGSTDDPVRLFDGIVVRVSLKVREHTAPQLIVECRHAATRLTVGRRSAYYLEQKDSAVIESLLRRAGIDAEIEDTTVEHRHLVQFQCSDWEFLLSRAAATGLCVLTRPDGIRVTRLIRADSSPVCTLQFGSTLLEFDGEIDARAQVHGVRASSWDPSQQTTIAVDATDPALSGPGNLATDELADVIGLDRLHLVHPAMTEPEAQSWADATWARTQLRRVAGGARCEGIATVAPGDIVELAGLGDRFSGKAIVTGVRHECDLVQGWKTHLQFGTIDTPSSPNFHDTSGSPAPPSLIPPIVGLQLGIVVSNEDPEGEHRVRVRLPLIDSASDGTWARVASPDAGNDRGFFFRPEIGDEVVIGFLHDDPRHAVILGMLHSSARPAPLSGSDDNPEKCYQSREKMILTFNDEKKSTTWKTPAGNAIVLDENARSVTISDQNGNTIALSRDGISLESSTALTLKAATALKIEAGSALEFKSGGDLMLQATSGTEVSSTGITRIRGSLVQIN